MIYRMKYQVYKEVVRSDTVHDGPVQGVESQEAKGQQDPRPGLHLPTELLLPVLFAVDDEDVLEHEEVDKHDAGHHPDVEEGDVADL